MAVWEGEIDSLFLWKHMIDVDRRFCLTSSLECAYNLVVCEKSMVSKLNSIHYQIRPILEERTNLRAIFFHRHSLVGRFFLSSIPGKGGDPMNCIICGKPTEHPSFRFCDECLNAPVSELMERYLQRERASTPGKEEKALSVSETLTKERTHR